jgi:periplasmic divalent cation tolerance protein
MHEISLVLVTAGSEEEAAKIGRTLVEEKLAACASMVPRIRSIYRWKGEIHDEQETLILIKTRTSMFAALRNRIRELHSYEVPEIVALPISRGLREYLDWVVAETEER